MNDSFALPSSPIMSRKPAAAATGRNHLAIPSAVEIIEPSSPAIHRLFETPIKQRPAMYIAEQESINSTPPEIPNKVTKSKNSILFETPAKKMPASSAPPKAASISQKNQETCPSSNTPTNKQCLSLDQQLGWDDYDFDDL